MKAPIHDLHVGNLLTYGSLAAALAAVAVSGVAGAPAAGGWLALAALLDTFDGRFARCFERTSRQRRIGCEIDSLVDVCAFGMGPVVVLGGRFAAGQRTAGGRVVIRQIQRPGADSGARFGDPVTARGYRLGWITAAGTCGTRRIMGT